jgi:ankyrin repeat protein
VKALLEAGAEVNRADGEGQTALDTAIFSGSVEIVNLLLAKGATIERSPSILCNPARWGHTEIVKVLLKAGVSPRHHIRRIIYLASEDGHTEIVRAILTANKRKVDKRALIRPLFMARSQGNLEMVNLLLEAGADPQMEPTIRRSL